MAVCVNNVHIDLALFIYPGSVGITFYDINPLKKNPSIFVLTTNVSSNFNPALWCEPDLLDKDVHWAPRTALPALPQWPEEIFFCNSHN